MGDCSENLGAVGTLPDIETALLCIDSVKSPSPTGGCKVPDRSSTSRATCTSGDKKIT